MHAPAVVLLEIRKWDINSPRAQCVHQLITEMIALDSQPLSIVNDVGFTRLLRELEPRYSIPVDELKHCSHNVRTYGYPCLHLIRLIRVDSVTIFIKKNFDICKT